MSSDAAQLVTFALGVDPYGVDVAQVREVAHYSSPRHLPTPTPWMLGVVGLRDRLVPVCDLHARLGLAPSVAGPERRIIVVGADDEPAGMVVDRIDGLVDVPAGGLLPLPVGNDPLLAGIAPSEGALVVVLDLATLLAEVGGLGVPKSVAAKATAKPRARRSKPAP